VSYTPSDEEIIADILTAARQVIAFTQDLDERAFRADEKTQSATIHALQIMGEATKRLTMAFRDRHMAVDWRGMAGMRDVLIHHYDRVDLSLVWAVAIQQVPVIAAYLEGLLPSAE
jgi:uncharacterized protein with HEPN domain